MQLYKEKRDEVKEIWLHPFCAISMKQFHRRSDQGLRFVLH